MKTVLLATSKNGRGAVFELPRVLKQAGLHVTLMCDRKTRGTISSYHDAWIEAPEEAPALLTEIAARVEKSPAYDWIILGDDDLLTALADSRLDPALKTRLGPVGKPEYLSLLGSKVETARVFQAKGILMPPSKPARSAMEAAEAATEIGFPVLVKIDHSGGGKGVFKCHARDEILARQAEFENQSLLVEKFIEGKLISVEALFLNGKLVTYAYSDVIACAGFGVSARRRYRPGPAVKTTLEAMAENFFLHCFSNLGFIHDKESGKHYLFEADLRANAWVAYARFGGVDMARALAAHLAGGPVPTPDEKERIVSMPHREIRNFIAQKQFLSLLLYVCNPLYWRFIPFHDLRLALGQLTRLRDFLGGTQKRPLPVGPFQKA